MLQQTLFGVVVIFISVSFTITTCFYQTNRSVRYDRQIRYLLLHQITLYLHKVTQITLSFRYHEIQMYPTFTKQKLQEINISPTTRFKTPLNAEFLQIQISIYLSQAVIFIQFQENVSVNGGYSQKSGQYCTCGNSSFWVLFFLHSMCVTLMENACEILLWENWACCIFQANSVFLSKENNSPPQYQHQITYNFLFCI